MGIISGIRSVVGKVKSGLENFADKIDAPTKEEIEKTKRSEAARRGHETRKKNKAAKEEEERLRKEKDQYHIDAFYAKNDSAAQEKVFNNWLNDEKATDNYAMILSTTANNNGNLGAHYSEQLDAISKQISLLNSKGSLNEESIKKGIENIYSPKIGGQDIKDAEAFKKTIQDEYGLNFRLEHTVGDDTGLLHLEKNDKFKQTSGSSKGATQATTMTVGGVDIGTDGLTASQRMHLSRIDNKHKGYSETMTKLQEDLAKNPGDADIEKKIKSQQEKIDKLNKRIGEYASDSDKISPGLGDYALAHPGRTGLGVTGVLGGGLVLSLSNSRGSLSNKQLYGQEDLQ